MKGDIPSAALRLAASSTVSTHMRSEYVHIQGSKDTTPIKIGGTVYESMSDAARQLQKSRSTIRLMIQKGEAKHA